MVKEKIFVRKDHPLLDKKPSPQQQVKQMMSPLIDELEKYHIPEDKMEAVIEFSVNLFAKYHRHMTTSRMLRKIVEEFKLKPLPKTESDASDQTSGS